MKWIWILLTVAGMAILLGVLVHDIHLCGEIGNLPGVPPDFDIFECLEDIFPTNLALMMAGYFASVLGSYGVLKYKHRSYGFLLLPIVPSVLGAGMVLALPSTPEARRREIAAAKRGLLSDTSYRKWLSIHAHSVGDCLSEIGRLMLIPRFFDPGWIGDMNVQLTTLRNLASEARMVSPPSSFSEIHKTYLAIMDGSCRAADLCEAGIRKGGEGAIEFNEASAELDAINKLAAEVSAGLSKRM